MSATTNPRRGSTASHAALALSATVLLPLCAYVVLGSARPGLLNLALYLVAFAYVLTVGVLVLETRAALGRRAAPRPASPPRAGDPVTSVIVSAYLPNEQSLILETLLHLATQLDVSTSRLQVIVAYNTPDPLPIEQQLQRLRELTLHVEAVHVPQSASKAENIAHALPLVRGDMTVLLDADHHIAHDAIERARRWLDLGYDIVQGRCVVRNRKETWLTRLVCVEFEQIYAVAHAGRSLLFDTAIFGGTNGYWRTSVLREIGMDTTMLTEDIDSSVRAMLAGHRLVHDRSIVSSELATTTLAQWYSQRMRWAQGWFQVTLRHQRPVLESSVLSPALKVYWTLLLSWRELFPVVSLQAPLIVLASVLLGNRLHFFGDPFLSVTTVLTFASGMWASWACQRVALPETRAELRWSFVVFALLSWPYTLMKNCVVLLAITREILGDRRWVVTARTATPTSTLLSGRETA